VIKHGIPVGQIMPGGQVQIINFVGCLHIAVPTYPQDATVTPPSPPSTIPEVDALYEQYRADEAYYEYGEYIGPSEEQIAGFENP